MSAMPFDATDIVSLEASGATKVDWGDVTHRQQEMRGHEMKLERHAAKDRGIFYTPNKLAHLIAKHRLKTFLAKANSRTIFNLRLLDPACGTGVFLVEALCLLIKRLQELRLDSYSNRFRIVNRCFFASDRDAKAVELCRQFLHRTCLYPPSTARQRQLAISKDNFHIKDALLVGSAELFGEFTHILGNPPYILARGPRIPADEKLLLTKEFGKYELGKINTYVLFVLRCLDLLKGGGSMSLLIPNAWLGIQDGYHLRKLLFESNALEGIDHLDFRVFAGAGVETVVLHARKEAPKRVAASRKFVVRHFNELSPTPTTVTPISYRTWAKMPRLQIPLQWSEEIAQLTRHLEENCILLGASESPFVSRIALQAYAQGRGNPPQDQITVKEHRFHSNVAIDSNYLLYLDGRDVSRYRYKWSGSFLNYGTWLAEPQTIERFNQPRLLLREILNTSPYRINACFISETALYNKSVLHVLGKVDCTESQLLALLAILNSAFAGRLISLFGRKSQRSLFPKLVNADLKFFPIPKEITGASGPVEDLARLAKQQITATRKNGGAENKEIQRSIDAAVVAVYRAESFNETA